MTFMLDDREMGRAIWLHWPLLGIWIPYRFLNTIGRFTPCIFQSQLRAVLLMRINSLCPLFRRHYSPILKPVSSVSKFSFHSSQCTFIIDVSGAQDFHDGWSRRLRHTFFLLFSFPLRHLMRRRTSLVNGSKSCPLLQQWYLSFASNVAASLLTLSVSLWSSDPRVSPLLCTLLSVVVEWKDRW